MTNTKRIFLALMLASAAALPISVGTFDTANAATADDLNKDASQALQSLSKTNPLAEQISKKAQAVLVFPSIVKAGLVFGGSYGKAFSDGAPQSSTTTTPSRARGACRREHSPTPMSCFS